MRGIDTSLAPLTPFRRVLGQIDWLMVISIIGLSGFGVLMIFSAIHSNAVFLANALHWKQALWSALGLCLLSTILVFDYHTISKLSYLFYAVVVASLVLVFVIGRVVYGAKRWIVMGPVRVQPSELAKLAVILVIARYFGTRESTEPLKFRDLIIPFILVIIPVGLVARQPDLGTAMTILMIAVVMVLVVGMERRVLLYLASAGVAVLPVGWLFLKDYQKRRILTVFNPDADILGAGYQSMQSKIAVGSGEIWGKGLLQGTQSRLHFLPEKHTDFIFSVLSEELGFVGGAVLLILFLVFIQRCFQTALNAADKEGTLIAVGVGTSFFLYTMLNIGMTLGIFPIVGIPLPFVSYGGSASLTSFIAVGLVLNVRIRRRSSLPFYQYF
ncbi:MAG: rod shape-determining protein RodA [Nitrospinota bacterium]|jgi:rod shape determining protein RodA|nr:rod shape-determining protein RodA [Nitrospinota bacterium]